MGSRLDHGHGPSGVDMMCDLPQEVSSDLPKGDRKLESNGIYDRDPDSHSHRSESSVLPTRA